MYRIGIITEFGHRGTVTYSDRTQAEIRFALNPYAVILDELDNKGDISTWRWVTIKRKDKCPYQST